MQLSIGYYNYYATIPLKNNVLKNKLPHQKIN
jgi:hypothetical protein